MGQFSLVHWLILGVVLVLALGGGRFSTMMGDVAKGIKQFKKGMADEDDAPVSPRAPSRIEVKPGDPALDRESDKVREER